MTVSRRLVDLFMFKKRKNNLKDRCSFVVYDILYYGGVVEKIMSLVCDHIAEYSRLKKKKKGSKGQDFQCHAFFLALRISDLCQQREKCFALKVRKINLRLYCGFLLWIPCIFWPTTQVFKFDEQIWNKERAEGYERLKVPTQSTSSTEQGRSLHLSQYSTCAYYELQGWNWHVNTFSKRRNV